MWTTAVAPQKLVCRQAGLFGACSGPWGRGPGVWCLRPASRLCAVLASEHPLRARCPLPGSRPFRGAGASPTPREASSAIPSARRRSSRAMIPRRLLLRLTIRRFRSRTSRAGSSQLCARRGADLSRPPQAVIGDARLSPSGGRATCRSVLGVVAGCAFGAGEVAASFLLLADGALFGCCLAGEVDDGVVVVAVGGGAVAASAVVGIALGVFLGC